ncbi:MAG: hypothetical protein HAW67_00050 [Endozoicomonadaceae bacterium]|nr:hypothetical protein [Endozoicomonadaceae bacterium]
MGWLSSIGSAIGSVGRTVLGWVTGSGSSSDSGDSRSSRSDYSSYEPDKVKIAEIEQETQLQLAGKEQERIELMKNAKIEILREEAMLRDAHDQAKIKGFKEMSEAIILLQERFNDVSEKRLAIIEQGSFEIIKDIETFYRQLQVELENNDIEFTENKLPKLLDQLEKYEEGTASHTLYNKKIDALITNQTKYVERMLTDLSDRQSKIIDSALTTKAKILEHTDQLTTNLVTQITEQVISIGNSNNTQDLEFVDAPKQLEKS